ncbi:MAG: hypothetical protein M0Z33_07185 [Actinomycetota bacterium]|nr:hypothetical protein [Actinomycetota bacterium]
MRRYVFRLASVLRLRRAEEEQARERLQLANTRLRERILARDAEAARYRALVARAPAEDADGLRTEMHTASLAAATVDAARRSVATAASDVALAQIEWQVAARRVEILERLDDRRRMEHLAEEGRAEVAVVDDLVTARFVRDRDDSRAGARP